MKKWIVCLVSLFFIAGCDDNKRDNIITFAVSAEYPPFEYLENGEIKGFDIEVAQLIAERLGKKAAFKNMQFSTILPSLLSGGADAGISAITITTERAKNFDFSDSYHFETMAVLFKKNEVIEDKTRLVGKKIACQLGSTMEIWAKKQEGVQVVAIDDNVQAVELLKAGYVDGVIINGLQGKAFSDKNSNLDYKILEISKNGYAIAFKKGSPLTEEVNQALVALKASGQMLQLKTKWQLETQ